MTDEDTDPMLGDASAQQAYQSQVLRQTQDEIESRRAARRSENARPSDSPAVIVGATQFGDGIGAIS